MKKYILILFLFSVSFAQVNIWKLVGTNILPYNSTYLTAIRLATATPAGVGAIRYQTGNVQYHNGSAWITLAASSGGAVGNADSLGGQPANKYFLKSDTTYLHALKFSNINDSILSHNNRINALVSGVGSADSSVYVTKNTAQVISGSKTFTATVNIIGSTSGALKLSNTSANSTNKLGRIIGNPFTNTDSTFMVLDARGLSGTNEIGYGGGSSLLGAVQKHRFYAGNNVNSTEGTERITIDSVGLGIAVNTPLSKLQIGNLNTGTGEANGHGLISLHSEETSASSEGGLEFKSQSAGSGVGAKIWSNKSDHKLYISGRYGTPNWATNLTVDLDNGNTSVQGSLSTGGATPDSQLTVNLGGHFLRGLKVDGNITSQGTGTNTFAGLTTADSLRVKGARYEGIDTTSLSRTITTETTLLCINTTNITITLPPLGVAYNSATKTGRVIFVKKGLNNGASITIVGTIDGYTNIATDIYNTSYELQAYSTGWIIR